MHQAAGRGDLAIVQCLCEHIGPATVVSGEYVDNWTPLHQAARWGNSDAVVRYLLEIGFDRRIDAVTEYGYTPLLYAAEMGRLSVVQCLCAWGADKEARDDSGYTALHRAARFDHLAVVQRLCEHWEVDCTATNEYRMTALHVAAFEGSVAVVRYMCQSGKFDLSARCEEDYTPLETAKFAKRSTVLDYLLERGV